jgi:hypothetical protein
MLPLGLTTLISSSPPIKLISIFSALQFYVKIILGKFYESKRRKATGLTQQLSCHGSRAAKIYLELDRFIIYFLPLFNLPKIRKRRVIYVFSNHLFSYYG